MGEKLVQKLAARLKTTTPKPLKNQGMMGFKNVKPDNSWESVQKTCKSDLKLRRIKLRKNLEHLCAINCYLQIAERLSYKRIRIFNAMELEDVIIDNKYLGKFISKHKMFPIVFFDQNTSTIFPFKKIRLKFS